MSSPNNVHKPATKPWRDDTVKTRSLSPTVQTSKGPKSSSAQQVFDCLYAYHYGLSLVGTSLQNNSLEFELPQTEFNQLLALFSQNKTLSKYKDLFLWFEEKASYDYDPPHLVFRMPTCVHQATADDINNLLRKHLGIISDKHPLLHDLIQDIRVGSRTVSFGSRRVLTPDGVIWVRKHRFPSIALEIAYSQNTSSLAKKAKCLIARSYGEICCVVGLDLSYDSPQATTTNYKATVSVWRPVRSIRSNGKECYKAVPGVDAITIRDENGEAQQGSLVIPLSDIIHASQLNTFPPQEREATISIPFQDLCSIVVSATRDQEEIDQAMRLSVPDNQLDSDYSSEDEELDSESEKVFRKREKESDEKSYYSDPTYTGGSTWKA